MTDARQPFDYATAFSSNLGILTPHEQDLLRDTTVAIPGMGGVGGAHLLTLTRLGIGRFAIADHDHFELKNFNRQSGATLATLGRPKTDVMAEMARAINPELSVRVYPDGLHSQNIDEFLHDCRVVVDGLDFFNMGARRLLFREARARQIPVVTCGPIGFGAAQLVFTPDGPSFDDYFAIRDDMEEREQLARFAIGLAPAGLHFSYLKLDSVSFTHHRGPSTAAAVSLCAGMAAVEILCFVLKRRPLVAVPRYTQFDPYRRRYRVGTLCGGNRHPLQQLKLWYFKRRLAHDFATP